MTTDQRAHDPTPDRPGEPVAEPAELGYAEALTELERILVELEGDSVDVDRLAEQVRRAADLIRLCRQRVASARLQIETVVAELDGDPPG
jgi:exodeoxyribonuclease VII small subunit